MVVETTLMHFLQKAVNERVRSRLRPALAHSVVYLALG